MDLLSQVLSQVWQLFVSYLDWWIRAVAAVDREFGWNMPPALSQLAGVALGILILVAFGRRLVTWDRKGNKSQAFPLKTFDTPEEVLAKDRDKFLSMVVKVVLAVLLVVVLASSR